MLVIALCVLMGKIADADGRSGFVWGSITLVVCLVSLPIPIPFGRFLFAGLAVFGAMMVSKMMNR